MCLNIVIYNVCLILLFCYYNICGVEFYFYYGWKCWCGDYKNYSNVEVIFNWFGVVRMFCLIYLFLGIIFFNKNFVYYVGFSEGLL